VDLVVGAGKLDRTLQDVEALVDSYRGSPDPCIDLRADEVKLSHAHLRREVKVNRMF
jgi:hypothetical protein